MFNLFICSMFPNPCSISETLPLNGFFSFSFFDQGSLISSLPENNNPGEGFQAGIAEERTGKGHQEDGNVITS